MHNLTKMKILKPAHEVYESFVDPVKIGNFWFSSSSARWEPGKTITLKYEEYDALGEIDILEIDPNKKIVFSWGANGEGHKVTMTFNEVEPSTTIIEVLEEGFEAQDLEGIGQLLDNKEGWVFMLTCLKGYLECGMNQLRTGLVK